MALRDDDNEFLRQLAWIYPSDYIAEVKQLAEAVVKEQLAAGQRQDIRDIVRGIMDKIRSENEESIREQEQAEIRQAQAAAKRQVRDSVRAALSAGQPNIPAGMGPEGVEPLIEALGDDDACFAANARSALGRLTDRGAIDAFCSEWARSRNAKLEQILLAAGYLASQPLGLRLLTVLKTDADKSMLACGSELVPELLAAVDDDDRSIAGRARQLLLNIACDYLSSVVRQAGQALGVNGHSVIVFTVPAEACASDAVWHRYSRWLDDVVRQAGYTRLELVEQPLAAAWGAGMLLKPAERFLVIDIEDDCIEAAVAQVALGAGSSDARRLRIVSYGREWLTDQEEVAACEQLLQRTLRQAGGLGCAGGTLAGIVVTGSSRWCSGLRNILQRSLGGIPLYDRNLRQAAACGAAALTAGSDACGYIRHNYGVRYLDSDKYHYRQLVASGTFYPSDGPTVELTIKASYQDQQQFALFIYRLEDSYCVNEDSPLIITASAPVGCELPAIYAGLMVK